LLGQHPLAGEAESPGVRWRSHEERSRKDRGAQVSADALVDVTDTRAMIGLAGRHRLGMSWKEE
jgi:hypothetical protein